MKTIFAKTIAVAVAGIVTVVAIVSVSPGRATTDSDLAAAKQAVLARLAEIENAAQQLDPDKVFSFVLENDEGALVQNGNLFLTQSDALAATKRAFERLQKVDYRFDEQHITLLSPTVALAVGAGSSSATTDDGRALETAFAQSVIFVLTDGEWKVFHAHRSFPLTK